MQPQADPLWGYFSHVAGQDGQIDAGELQRCLTSSGIGGSYQPFSKETCRIMITMLDRDYSGQMGFSEFKELWASLNQWKVNCRRLLVLQIVVYVWFYKDIFRVTAHSSRSSSVHIGM